MKVRDLINHLMTLDGDLNIYVQGYEDGLVDIEKSNIIKRVVARDINTEWWEGPHNYSDGSHKDSRESIVITRQYEKSNN